MVPPGPPPLLRQGEGLAEQGLKKNSQPTIPIYSERQQQLRFAKINLSLEKTGPIKPMQRQSSGM